MPESRRRQTKKRGKGRGPTPPRRSGLPPVDGIVRSILASARELLEVEDPFEAEMWASAVLGMSYKQALPIGVQEEFPKVLWNEVVTKAERRADPAALAALRAIAAVADPDLADEAARAADELAARGVPEPPWADVIGRPGFIRAWTLEEPYGDQVGYYAHFRYAGSSEHLVAAVYDENLGAIIKDATAGELATDPRAKAEAEPGVSVSDIDPGELAARVRAAIATGDMFIDNDWTDDFRALRALLLARMRLLPHVDPPEPEEPIDDDAREALIEEFLALPDAPTDDDATRSILDHCLMARCDFGDGDPLRWSPTVVEMFMLDFVPRKGSLDLSAVRALPDVLRRWVGFALERRGLDPRWIEETQATVDQLAPEFRTAATDPSSFGPAKAIASAMAAAGVALEDSDAVQAWIEGFNARPFEERDEFLSRFDPGGEPGSNA